MRIMKSIRNIICYSIIIAYYWLMLLIKEIVLLDYEN